jgi:hypothetical protein
MRLVHFPIVRVVIKHVVSETPTFARVDNALGLVGRRRFLELIEEGRRQSAHYQSPSDMFINYLK